MHISAAKKKMIMTLVLATALVGYGLAAASSVAAAPAAKPAAWFRLVPECATIKGEPGKPPPVPSLVCVLQTFGNIAMIILGVTGSLALLMFVYGGFLMVISGGSAEKVTQGKKAITNAVIGIFIIMCSGLLIQYGMDQLQLSPNYKAVGVHCSGDNTPCSKPTCKSTFVQLPDGSLKCVAPGGCKELEKYNMECLIVTGTGTGVGKYCIPNLCESARGEMCCYKPPTQ